MFFPIFIMGVILFAAVITAFFGSAALLRTFGGIIMFHSGYHHWPCLCWRRSHAGFLLAMLIRQFRQLQAALSRWHSLSTGQQFRPSGFCRVSYSDFLVFDSAEKGGKDGREEIPTLPIF